ncbi:DNA polymerase subunit gamma-1, mitochondrial [Chrysoperla carnea]|uniref:DNA polymerase subunit gamma-1, mitochondrial n=1 Tax=Chrysoperla carnea TaxID=189513 RepID=UPI001D09270C|nr:DNA polymerase subunit gamma-1, mitochondrial [Chrysoperla carnea]
MISKKLYNQLFDPKLNQPISSDVISKCLQEFEKHGIDIKTAKPVPDVDLKIPKFCGASLEEHFHNIGLQQAKPYLDLISEFLFDIPVKPKQWLMQSGWTRYKSGQKPEKVDFPLEDCMVFDVEVCSTVSSNPVLATAVTNQAWYAWISEDLVNKNSTPKSELQSLIPLESTNSQIGNFLDPVFKKPRVVVGHNVSYDRARVKEQYWIERTGTRFVDTMSLHICVSGITSYQRAVLKSGKFDESDEKWLNSGSLNSLVDVYKLYCNEELSKETRDIFIKGNLDDVRENFDSLIAYCTNDVEATYKVLQKIFPLFLERFPHPVTFAGMLELGTAYLPVTNNWKKYIKTAEETFNNLESKTKSLLTQKANEAYQLAKDNKYKQDLWMWDQDWSPKILKRQSKLPEEQKFAEYPAWYRKLCEKPKIIPEGWIPTPNLISTSMRITPKLLKLTWEGYPLHYIQGHGWGFLVPFTTDLDQAEKIPLKELIQKCPVVYSDRENTVSPNMSHLWKDVQENLARKEYYTKKKIEKQNVYKGTGVWCNVIVDNCCYFMKLPHKDGESNRVGNPLSKDFITKFSENVLASEDGTADKILEIGRLLTYWRNNRDRILNQIVIWLNHNEIFKNIRINPGFEYGAIIPQIVVCGTLTRRAVEATWMTASNSNVDRVGSELRGFVQAPPGYNIVGADVDSQELWIASVIGDADVCQTNGATPLGWMTLSGNKASGTDMHTVTARAVGISRDQAKVINYARIYGAGQNFAERLLKQYNPTMTSNEARSKAMKMFSMTKGKRFCRIRNEYFEDFVDKPYSIWDAQKLAKAHGKILGEMFYHPKWVGGTESAMFNRLEEIATQSSPRTPFLDSALSRALEPGNMPDDRFLPTRVNWVVQSGAVDFLHLMLVSMRWLMKEQARFVLSFHDEIRYMVPEKYKYDAALAMHITNLLTRAFCVKKLGLNDLPMSVAFFSSVEVDTVLRKECKQDCITPSNPEGLEKGYGIQKGESLDIYETLKKCNGLYEESS